MARRKTDKQKFEELRDKWYKKLKREGFDDIETKHGQLKKSSSNIAYDHSPDAPRNKYSKESLEAKITYFSYAEHFLNDYKFDFELHRVVWAYHAEAISCRDISKLLAKVSIRMNKDDVQQLLKRLRTSMFEMYLIAPKREYRE